MRTRQKFQYYWSAVNDHVYIKIVSLMLIMINQLKATPSWPIFISKNSKPDQYAQDIILQQLCH